MADLRKNLYHFALAFNRPAALALADMREKQWLAFEQVQAIQQERLEQILGYAYQHVPYYKNLFEKNGLIQSGQIIPERFEALPTLDKPTIRANFQALISDEANDLDVLENRTSGSTGEPLLFLQDRNGVRVTGGAVLRFFCEWHGIEPGDKEIRLWGLERDLFYKARFSWNSIREWMSGLKMLNAFRMTPERMKEYIETINHYRPKLLRGYSANLFEVAQFAETHGLAIRPPDTVFSSAGTLYPPLRRKMETVYGCSVFNHYGAREMHNMAMECPEKHLHISAFTHMIEVVDDQNQPCSPGVEGDLLVTSFENRAMPFIRYRIGDRGAWSEETCTCGRGLPSLSKLSGRRVDCFWTKDGRIIPGEYFIYLLAVHLHDNPIAKYQVIQEDYDRLRFRLVLRTGDHLTPDIQHEIEDKTHLVMGPNCAIEIEYVEDILPAPSGKYFYTICEIPDLPQPEAPGLSAEEPHA